MSFDVALLDLMPSTLLERELTSFDRGGEPIFSTAIRARYRCLVVEKAVAVRNQMGQNSISSHIAYIRSTGEPPKATSEYTFPDGTKPGFLNAEQYYDDHGRYGAVIYFGSEAGG